MRMSSAPLLLDVQIHSIPLTTKGSTYPQSIVSKSKIICSSLEKDACL